MWNLIPYAIDLMTAGVAMARNRSKPAFTPVRFPERIRYMSRTMKHRRALASLCGKVGGVCNISVRKCQSQMLPYLRFIFKKNETMAESIAEELDLTEEEVKLIKG